MTPLEEFLAVNNLKQKDLVEYLSLSKGAISSAVSGRTELSEPKKARLMMNKAWDTSMLPYGRYVQTIGSHSPNANNTITVADESEIALLKEKIAGLEKICEEKERTIRVLLARFNEFSEKV